MTIKGKSCLYISNVSDIKSYLEDFLLAPPFKREYIPQFRLVKHGGLVRVCMEAMKSELVLELVG